MIVYELTCGNGHRFEAWFRDGAAFDHQSAAGDVSCPLCADTRVGKAPMAPHVAKASVKPESGQASEGTTGEDLFETLEALRRHVEQTCEYVGGAFPEEARRIHYGETKKRDIYGEASERDADSLQEEGIQVRRVPWIRRRNG